MHMLWWSNTLVNTTCSGRQLKSTQAYYMLSSPRTLTTRPLHSREGRRGLYARTMAQSYPIHDSTPQRPFARLYRAMRNCTAHAKHDAPEEVEGHAPCCSSHRSPRQRSQARTHRARSPRQRHRRPLQSPHRPGRIHSLRSQSHWLRSQSHSLRSQSHSLRSQSR